MTDNKIIASRLEALREEMRREHLSAFIFPSSDPHMSEYVPSRWEGRKWISGFDGSAGTAVVTLHSAALWTDSRYFIADVYNIDDETLQERLVQFEGFMHDEIMGTKKYLRDFSQGNRQKIGIIGAMIINPKVLLLDEPFNYLDPSSQMTIAHMIQRICKEQGTTVIISSHNLNFIADISSRILLLEKGKLVKDLPNADGAAIAELNEYFGIQAE